MQVPVISRGCVGVMRAGNVNTVHDFRLEPEEVVYASSVESRVPKSRCMLAHAQQPSQPTSTLCQTGILPFARLLLFFVVHTWTYKQWRDSKVLACQSTSQNHFLHSYDTWLHFNRMRELLRNVDCADYIEPRRTVGQGFWQEDAGTSNATRTETCW